MWFYVSYPYDTLTSCIKQSFFLQMYQLWQRVIRFLVQLYQNHKKLVEQGFVALIVFENIRGLVWLL